MSRPTRDRDVSDDNVAIYAGSRLSSSIASALTPIRDRMSTMNLAAFDSPSTAAAYLRTLPAIRERCGRVHALAKEGKLEYFDYHPEKEQGAAAFYAEIIKVHHAVTCSICNI